MPRTRRWVWDAVLVLIAGAVALRLISSFFPGRANVDIVSQAKQALGEIPYSDWHPPLMSALWGMLISTTGEIGSLYVLQSVAYAAALGLLCIAVHRRTGSKALSLLPGAALLTPWAVSQLPVLWKDVQMAAALLLGVALIIVVPRRRPGLLLAAAVPAVVLFAYATGVRINAVFALVPLAGLLGWRLVADVPRLRAIAASGRLVRRFAAVAGASAVVFAAVVAGTAAANAAVERSHEVEATGSISQIFLDDVMFSVPPRELRESAAPRDLVERIDRARTECYEKQEPWDSYWNCFGRGESGEAFSPLAEADQQALRELWISEVITHPLRYADYRATVYSHYLFSSSLVYWELGWDGDAAEVGLGSHSRLADQQAHAYVVDFGLGSFPVAFVPWFWGAGAVAGLLLVRRSPMYRPEIAALCASALVYILGYFPIAPANHFRYTYWPVLAVSAAAALGAAALLAQRRTRRSAAEEPPAG